ncbi:MAG: hypothetical protein GC134_06315 [Proteobacteria bacterium]|nr:hypothetical protein [Pseudomonadota bacterium]
MTRFTYQVTVRPKWADTRYNPARSFAHACDMREKAATYLIDAGFAVDATDLGPATDEPMGFQITCPREAAQMLRNMPGIASVIRLQQQETVDNDPPR